MMQIGYNAINESGNTICFVSTELVITRFLRLENHFRVAPEIDTQKKAVLETKTAWGKTVSM